MLTFVNAKINLGLRVVRRLENGYHQLQTIFYPIGLHNGTPKCPYPFCDILEATPAPEASLKVQGWDDPLPVQSNLVWKAWEAYRSARNGQGCTPQIILDKNLPSQAGMGGGSADASMALRLFNALDGNPLSREKLLELALSLGADCPFFLLNRPALANGVGEILTPLPERLAGMWCAVVKPPVSMSTREAFARIVPHGTELDLLSIYEADFHQWRQELVNDFEAPFLSLYPECSKIKELLYEDGAEYATLSGSGSSFIGIFPTRQLALDALAHQNTPYKAIALL